MRRRILPILLLVVIAAGAWYFATRSGRVASDGLSASGTVEATEADIGFQTPGRIETIGVREGDRVAAGDTLAKLDTQEIQARLESARAFAAAARAQLTELQRGPRREEIAQARAGSLAAESRLADARRELERARTLFDGGAISREAFDRAQTSEQVAAAQYDQAKEQLTALENGTRPERIAAARAQMDQAEAAVRQADVLLSNATLVAPFSGVITVRHREPGEVVGAGAPVVTVMNPDDRWVRIYVREDAIGRIAIGAPAGITSDSDPTHVYDGTVTYISGEAEFTPRNVQTTEERVKLVYAVKIRITGDPAQDLKTGMPADVRLPAGGTSE
jgi:membrane fusion protein YbhG